MDMGGFRMILAILAILFIAACSGARHLQGMDKANLPLKRIWRMVLFWPPATAFGVAVGWAMGAPWWAWSLALIPYVWSSLPGEYNVFALKNLFGITRHPTAEYLQGALGAITAIGLMALVLGITR